MASHPPSTEASERGGCNCHKEIVQAADSIRVALAETESRLSAKLDSILSFVGPKVATAVRIKFEPQ